ncbi:TPA: cell wall-binding repeat-containing protein [Clostridioides difficile]|uniref:cell wall-binding repeat-containing protein n=1 Tax=Clostridioides difficile TaxID=1496 RepID=UPI00093CB916|nr:cell wall-binding repeat-containing protein [Clostridioides difficile]EGT3943993.1 cell wall-binding repeat-containing protein [Clostridioides difficile]MBG0197940.1 cell wall-binding repeat-containing protein [Clostridioides difficile]MCA0574597.1 cell wall-binding repeat-containing protein [Clostridioides difficile]SJT19433.1 N-acetylmuramoyl-L-alanine amidase LytC precursor [Clostridioides difficile]HBE8979557.1 cell wall-binding repeat-containing protein [Clostridioides difficile]
MNNIKKFLLIILNMILILSNVYIPTNALEKDVKVDVSQNPDIDIVLVAGKTSTSLSTFERDIKNSLKLKGVDINKVNVQAIQSSQVTAESNFTWQKYDHGKGSVSGKDVIFNGYTEEGYSDFWFCNNTKIGEKTFTFTLNESQVKYHSFMGGGFLFGMKDYGDGTFEGYTLLIDSGTMSIKKIPRVSKTTFSNTNGNFAYENPSGSGTSSVAKMSTQTHDIKMVLVDNSVKVYENNTLKLDYTLSTSTPGEGFGIIADHNSHNCNETSTFRLSNLVMRTETSKEFNEVLRGPEWRDNSVKFIVNVEDKERTDFNSPTALGEIVSRMLNEEIYLVNLGTSNSKAQIDKLIASNNNNGIFITNTNYNSSIEQTAQYILEKLNVITKPSPYVLINTPFKYSISPEELKTDTISTEFPDGAWKIEHDYTYFDNSMGKSSLSGLYMDDFNLKLDKPGKLDISFEDRSVIPASLFVHRKPVANFGFSLSSNGSGYNINYTEASYDEDGITKSDRGIAEKEWKYKATTSSSWINGRPSTINQNTDYIVQLRVKDHQGVWSSPDTKYITTSNNSVNPISSFTCPKTVTKYEQLEITDNSYDPYARTITQYEWEIFNSSGTSIYKSSSPNKNIGNYGTGTYIYALRVKNSQNLWSPVFKRTINVVNDTQAPDIFADVVNHKGTPDEINVNLSFTDLGGSGFNSFRYKISNNISAGTWSDWKSETTSSVKIDKYGDNYLYVEAKDNNGNIAKRTFGRYTKTDITAPNIEADIESHSGTPDEIKVNLNFTDLGGSGFNSYRYQVSQSTEVENTKWSNWINKNSAEVKINTYGVNYIHIESKDNDGNISKKTFGTYRITDETAPEIEADIKNHGGTSEVIKVNLSFSDLGGSRFNNYRYQVSQSMDADDTKWSDWVSGDNGVIEISKYGENYIHVEAKDNDSNTSKKTFGPYNITDITPPEIETNLENDPGSPTSININLKFSDDEGSGFNSYRYKIVTNVKEDKVWSEWISKDNDVIKIESYGVNYLYIEAKDNDNNITQKMFGPYNRTDNIAPEIKADIENKDWTRSEIDVNLSFSDLGGSGFNSYRYQISRDEKETETKWSEWIAKPNGLIKISNYGKNYIHVEAKDNDGNTSKKTFGPYNREAPKPNSHETKFDDLVGENRFDTAIKISQTGWDSSYYLVLVNANSIVDAMTSSPLASSKKSPILLTEKNSLANNTKNEIKRLGVEKVYIIGGENMIDKNVENQLIEMNISIERVAGNDRFETSLKIAKQVKSQTGSKDVFVVNGENGLADAVSVGAIASQSKSPIILSDGNNIPKGLDIIEQSSKAYLIGGTNTISNSLEDKIPNSSRIFGENRNGTNSEVIKTFYKDDVLNNIYVVKNGSEKEEHLVDALAVSVLGAKTKSPVLIVGNTLDEKQVELFAEKRFEKVTKVGGNGNESCFNEIENIIVSKR